MCSLQFFGILQQNRCLKISKGLPFYNFGIVRFFKMNNFRLKLGFLWPSSLSDFLKTGVFSMRLFSSLFSSKPLFFAKLNVLEHKDSSVFSGLCDLPETFIKKIFEKFRKKSSIFCFFLKGFHLRKMIFFAVSNWRKMVYESFAYPFGYFLGL